MNMNGSLYIFARFAFYLSAVTLGFLVTHCSIDSAFFSAVDEDNNEAVSFFIEPKTTLRSISQELEERQLIKSWWSLYYLAELKNVHKDIQSKKKSLKPGEYLISPAMAPIQILNKLLSGEVVVHEVRVPAGITVSELPSFLASTGLFEEVDVAAALADSRLLDDLRIPSKTIEGYIYPGTYQVSRPTNARQFISDTVDEGRKTISNEMIERTIDLSLTYNHIIIIASILQKETQDKDAWPLLSSVIHNRLRISFPLQNDIVLKYGLGKLNEDLKPGDLRASSPYNLYLNSGLPPTAICNPSRGAIDAALYPAESDFLYYIKKQDGSYVYASTLKEHLKQKSAITGKKEEAPSL